MFFLIKKYPSTGLYYAVKVVGKKRLDEGERVTHFSLNSWSWKDITEDTKEAIRRDEEDAKAEEAQKAMEAEKAKEAQNSP